MKFLAAVTVVLTIPMIVASPHGMNVALHGQQSANAFVGTLAASLAIGLPFAPNERRRRPVMAAEPKTILVVVISLLLLAGSMLYSVHHPDTGDDIYEAQTL